MILGNPYFWKHPNTPLEKYTNTFSDLALEMDEKTLEKEVAKRREHGTGRIVKPVLSGVYPALCQDCALPG